MKLEKERLDKLEHKVGRLTKVVEDLQRKMEHVQRWFGEQNGVVPLAASATLANQGNIKTSTSYMTPSQLCTLATTMRAPSKGITAKEVAQGTGRSMNLESANLHGLFLRGFLQRMRVGRKVYYKPKSNNRA